MTAGRTLRYFIAILIAGTVVLAIGAGYLIQAFSSPGPLKADTIVIVPRGAGLNVISAELQRAGVISNARAFAITARLKGDAANIRAGEFSFTSQISMSTVLQLIVSGKTVQRRVTVPEGLASRQVMALLNAAEGLEGDLNIVPDEGTLLPDTYFYSLWDAREGVLQRMKDRQSEAIAALMATPRLNLVLDEADLVTLASIVEKETGVSTERARVAAVFLNRLDKRMRLQSDPTVIYGLTGGEPLGRSLRRSELEGDTPYNTYVIRGLPPGPIANPGLASLHAVLHPAVTNDLYFVADGSGGHVFAETLEDHNRNVAQWRRIEREQQASQR